MNAQSRKFKDDTRREISFQTKRIERELKQKTRKKKKSRKIEKGDH